MQGVYVIGINMNRFGNHPPKTVRSTPEKVVLEALKDAGIAKEEVQAASFVNAFSSMSNNQHSIRGQVVFRGMGLGGIPVTNVENACAGASTGLHLACTGIRAGMHDEAIAAGSETLTRG